MIRSTPRLSYARPLVATSLRATQIRQYSYDSLRTGPAPPRLSKEDQEEFERLQREASTTNAFKEYNRKAEADAGIESDTTTDEPVLTKTDTTVTFNYHPEYRHVKPDFEGDKNPVTGEVGGPKQDPLRHGDYSFNGRVTDF